MFSFFFSFSFSFFCRDEETVRVETFLKGFTESDEFDLYFREGLRDTSTIPNEVGK